MRLAVFISLLFTSGFAIGQIDEYLVQYSVSEENKAAFVTWTTSAGFQCEDIMIEHGTDSTELETVYIYPGICGSDSKEEKYNYLFRAVEFNKPNYFRINLGRFGVSPLFDITIISAEGLKPKVFPNPATTESILLFQNSTKETVTINLYDVTGKKIGKPLTTVSDRILIGGFRISVPGIYIYIIELKGIKLRGKFYLL